MVRLVGVLNVTPDSFSDGGLFDEPEKAITHAAELFEVGADLVDVGAESTRPNATPLTDEEEWHRLEPVLQVLIPRYLGCISVDSYHPATIRKALALGPIIVNDITGMNGPEMVKTVCELKPKVIISHHPDMGLQQAHQLEPVSDVEAVKEGLLGKAALLESKGLSSADIILDPGIGFGKTMELNWELLKFAAQVPDYKVMIGYSRKRFLGEHRMELEPNIEAGKIAVAHGAEFLRVHDVVEHAQFLL